MLDIKYVREHLDEVALAMEQRHAKFDAAEFARLDEVRRAVIAEEEEAEEAEAEEALRKRREKLIRKLILHKR